MERRVILMVKEFGDIIVESNMGDGVNIEDFHDISNMQSINLSKEDTVKVLEALIEHCYEKEMDFNV